MNDDVMFSKPSAITCMLLKLCVVLGWEESEKSRSLSCILVLFVILVISFSFLFKKWLSQEQIAYDNPDRKLYHLCIVNLVIGWVAMVKAEHFACNFTIRLVVLSCTMDAGEDQ